MTRVVHVGSAVLGGLCVALFLAASLGAEAVGPPSAVAWVKRLVVWPGLALLVPALMVAGISGRVLAGPRPAGLARTKLARMRWIAVNGACVLVPCALLLDAWAAHGLLDGRFMSVQGVELIAGAVNLALIVRNARDGRRLTRR